MKIAPTVPHRPTLQPVHQGHPGRQGQWCRRQEMRRRAVTIMEVLIAIGVLAVFFSLLFPAVALFKEAYRKNQCKDHLKQIVLGVQQYHDRYKMLPYNNQVSGEGHGADSHSWSWMSHLLPYVGHADIYKDARIPHGTLLDAKHQIALPISVFLCPSDPRSAKGPSPDTSDMGVGYEPYVEVGYTNYKGVMGSNWGWGDREWHNSGPSGYTESFVFGDGTFYRADSHRRKSFAAITDGLNQTAIIGEALPDKSKWTAWPYSNSSNATCAIDPNARRANGKPYDPGEWQNSFGFYSYHANGLHFAFADGSIRFIRNSIDRKVYRAMSTIAGGETFTLP